MTADFSPGGVDLARQPDFQVGDLRVSPSRREVVSGVRRETLEPRVMQALVVMAARPDTVISRDELIERCWDGRIVGDDAINQCITKLRRVGMAHEAFTIEAVPRVGYRLSRVQGAPAAPSAAGGGRWMWALAAMVVVVVALGGGWLAWTGRATELTAQTPVAVLPFQVLSSDPAAKQLAASLGPEMAGVFAENQIQTVEPARGGRCMEIDGVVSSDAGRLHARLRLRDPQARATLWTKDFSAPTAQATRIEFEAAWRLTEVVKMVHEMVDVGGRDLDSIALGQFLQARDSIRSGTWRPVSLMAEATARAPRFAPGVAMRGMGQLMRSAYAPEPQASEMRRRAVADARRALAMRPGFPYTLGVLAAATSSRDWAGREALFRQGVWPENAPNAQLAQLMVETGRLQDGIVALGQVMDDRPSAPVGPGIYTYERYLAGGRDDALATIDRLLAMRPDDAMLRRTKLMITALAGDPDEALAILANPERRPMNMAASAVRAFTDFTAWRRSGKPADRARAIATIRAGGDWSGLPRPQAIPLLCALGATDEAFAVADAYASDPRVMRQATLLETAFLFGGETAPMRQDPRFGRLMEKLGLAGYWRATGHWPDFCEREPGAVCAAMKAAPTA